MTGGSPPKTEVEAREKRAKDKVRKSGTSAQGKALQLGEFAGVFSAVVYYNPTYRWLDGAVHVPEGQDIPDVNAFFAQILNDSPSSAPRHGPRRAQTCRQSPQDAHTDDTTGRDKMTAETASMEIDAAAEEEAGAEAGVPHLNNFDGIGAHCVDASPISHGGVSQECQVTEDTDSGGQLDQHLADGSALRGKSRRVLKQEIANDDVADDAGWAGTSGNAWDVSTHGLFDNVAGNKVRDGQSGHVPGWETSLSPYAEAPIARVTPPSLSKVRAAIRMRWFFRQVSLNMRLASRQEQRPPHRPPYQDRRRGVSQQSGR